MPTILIIEDNEMNRDMLSRRLLKRGFEVRTAINGLEAVTQAQELPDLILMDLSLPELDGIEATKRIKESPRTAHIPVIALTAHAMITDRERALAAGCADFDTKPVDFSRLLEKIGQQLRLRSTDAPPSPLLPHTDAQATPDDAADSTEQGRLLVVDDEPANRDMLSRRLAKRGYDVVCAASGSEALACVESSTFDAVLLDMMMPGMSGLEVLDRLRQTHAPLELPVVIVTARDRSEDIAEALGRGATDYITKPVDFPVAAARIRNHVQACRAQRSVRSREERYLLAARASSDAVWDWDVSTGAVFFSEQWGRLTGTASTSVVETLEHWLSLVHPADRDGVRQSLADHLRGGMPQWESEHRIRHADGSYRWVLACGVTAHDEGRPTRMAGCIADVTDARGSDPLTGLPNRLLFLERLERALSRPTHRCAVLFLDVDRFKEINDGLGHLAGDDLLQQVARRIEAGLRRGDMVGHLSERATLSRLGGDEFAVLLEHVVDDDAARLVAERISQGMLAPFNVAGREVTVSASIGIMVSSADMSALDMLGDADLAMYRAKARGRGLVEVFDETMRQEMQLRLTLENDLRQALVRGEFELLYQPIFALQHAKLHGFEALVRWRHPARGLLSPDAFLPAVQEAGLILELGRWVLRESCRQLRQWDGLQPDGDSLTMSVNVSPEQFATLGLVDDVKAALSESGIAAHRLKLEIVETTLLRGSDVVLETLRQLRELGVALVLDDFGTGYSSLSYLQAFPLSTLKIDRSFVMRMNSSETEPLEIVKTIVGLAHNLGLDVTAEGIETSQQLASLRQLACMFGQGYYFERPMAPADAQLLLMQGRRDEQSDAGDLGPVPDGAHGGDLPPPAPTPAG